ncbi:MAG: helix-turn-helix domain-containing protein [Halobacteriota archaeon]
MTIFVQLAVGAAVLGLEGPSPTNGETRHEFESVIPVGNGSLPTLRSTGGDLDTVVEHLRALPSVEVVEVVGSDGDEHLFRVRWHENEAGIIDPIQVADATLMRAVGAGSVWQLSLRFPDEGALSTFQSCCQELDITYTVERLNRTGSQQRDDAIRPKQLNTLRIAMEQGYFDVPRKVTLGELADELGVSDQAVSERIRRGLSAVLTTSLPSE